MLTLGPTADRLSAISMAPLSPGTPAEKLLSAVGLSVAAEVSAAASVSFSSGDAANRDASVALLPVSCSYKAISSGVASYYVDLITIRRAHHVAIRTSSTKQTRGLQ